MAKAFPGAYGAGSNTRGAAAAVSPTVYRVTSLANSGAGTLRDALSAGNRFIVFTVSGTIHLDSILTVTGDNITIAGQTAPAGGITITSSSISSRLAWRGDNAIIRYIKFRLVTDANDSVDGVDFEGSMQNIIIDHCSFAWGGDETISFYSANENPLDNINFSRNIVYKGWKGTIMGQGQWYDDGEVYRPTGNFSYNQNLVVHTSHRMPALATDDRMDVINNVIHSWDERILVAWRPTGTDLNVMGNYYSGGCFNQNPATECSGCFNWNAIGYMGGGRPLPLIHASGNFYNVFPSATQQSFFHWWFDGPAGSADRGKIVDAQYFTGTPFTQLDNAFTVLSAADTRTDLTTGGAGAVWRLDANGNRISDIDAIDQLAINDVINNTCVPYSYQLVQNSVPAYWSTYSDYTTFRSSISSTPINTHPGSFDTNNDGIPDAWTTANMGTDSWNDVAPSGYLWIEEYINQVDGASSPPPPPPTPDPSAQGIISLTTAGIGSDNNIDVKLGSNFSRRGILPVGATNLYTLANAANPVNEVNSNAGTDNQGEFSITSVSSNPTAQNGTYSLLFTRTAGDAVPEDAFINLNTLGLATGTSYTIRLYARHVTGTANWSVGLYASFGWNGDSTSQITNTGSWVEYTFIGAPSGVNPRIRILSPGGTVTGNSLAIDNIRITNT